MPSPDINDAHVDQLLTIFSHAYTQEAENYIADKVFPVIPVTKKSAKIGIYTKADWFMDDAGLRAPATESTETGYATEFDDYNCENYAVHKKVPDEVRENTDEPFNPDLSATSIVTDRLLMKREVKFSTDFIKTSFWGTSTDLVAAPWDDYGLSNPIIDVDTARDVVHSTTAREVNTGVMGRKVITALRNHPDLIEKIKYTQRGVLTIDLIAALLNINRLLIGNAIYNTAKKGQAASYSYIVGNSVLLMYVTPRPGLLEPSAGYIFHWKNFGALSYIRRVRDDKRRYDMIEGNTYFDQKAVGVDLGYYYYNVV
jgi:hypothetical protein